MISRKEQERLDRDKLILNVAKQILADEGIHALTMQAIANATQYSKGTIYQHYRSKEDVLAALVLQCGHQLLALIQRALGYSGSLRSKINLVSAAFFMISDLDPITSSLVFTVKSPEFLKKIAPEHAEEQRKIDSSIFIEVVATMRRETDFNEQEIMDLAFGWWAMNWGVQTVHGSGWEMDRLGFDTPMEYYFRSLKRYLDSMRIPPDHTVDSWEQVTTLAQSVFKSDLLQINNNKEVQ